MKINLGTPKKMKSATDAKNEGEFRQFSYILLQ